MFAFGDGACRSEMTNVAGSGSEGMYCSQPGIPTQMASKAFQDAFTAKYGEVRQYAPFFYDATNLLITAMQKADSTIRPSTCRCCRAISFDGARGVQNYERGG